MGFQRQLFLLVRCENCESISKPATLWCSKCEVCFCTVCFDEVHKSKALSQHERIPANKRPVPSVPCNTHKQERLKYWCEVDQKLLCQTCYDIDHKNHKIGTLENAAKAQEELVNCFVVKQYLSSDFRIVFSILDTRYDRSA